ncbi:unnamed protein product [Didymodactylos carnosus]|nr:unnamed protein product [Didymodactylos carnosus]
MHKGVPIRYRLHNLNVLHEQFQAETGTSCSYSMFCQYIPPNIKKPNVNDWGTCLCMLCLNPQMKLEKLIRMNAIDSTDTNLHNIIKDDLKFEEFLKKIKLLEKQKVTITYIEWQKEKQVGCRAPVSKKKTCTDTMKIFVVKLIKEIDVNYAVCDNHKNSFVLDLLVKAEANPNTVLNRPKIFLSNEVHIDIS